jgi:predicted ATP-dependent endonuclease of OLD family
VVENAVGDLNLKDLGTGVEQLLMTLTVGLMEAPPFTLVIEEPETNLHPAAQRALLGLLQAWAADRQGIIATHSPVMLDWSPGGDRLWLVTRNQETSHVDPVGEDPLPVLRSLGVRLSDVLSADRILVVEGPSDEEILAAWFPGLLRNPRVAVIRGGGGDYASHANQLASWLAGIDRAGLRSVLYLRDRDELSAATLERLTASPAVYVLERRELENYLLEPTPLPPYSPR